MLADARIYFNIYIETSKMATIKKETGIALVTPAKIITVIIPIRGKSPLVQLKFSEKAKRQMLATMETPATEKKAKSARPPRNYDEDFVGSQHISEAGWNGFPCSGFRAGMIAACRTVGLVMTQTKMSVFVEPDGFDRDDGTPLVRILAEPPVKLESLVRNDNGSADVRIRSMWKTWRMDVSVSFDADMISAQSVINLLDRAGKQVGIGEGRPFSKNSCGQGWGTFEVIAGETVIPQ